MSTPKYDIERIRVTLVEGMYDSMANDQGYAYSILSKGFIGFDHYTDTELLKEYQFVYGKEPPTLEAE